jgi:hypothetical protein
MSIMFILNFKLSFLKVAGMTYEALKQRIEELVRWVRVKVPGAILVTMDVVPRASVDGFFCVVVRRLAVGVKLQGAWHRHVGWLRALMYESRVGSRGVAKRARVDRRYVVRSELFRMDGVHLGAVAQFYLDASAIYAVGLGDGDGGVPFPDEDGLLVGDNLFLPVVKF